VTGVSFQFFLLHRGLLIPEAYPPSYPTPLAYFPLSGTLGKWVGMQRMLCKLQAGVHCRLFMCHLFLDQALLVQRLCSEM
jgi:hypothetical protein